MTEKQQRFIILRAESLSFDKISDDLKISKPTLIQWSKLFQKEIQELQFEAFIKLKETYGNNTLKRYEINLKQLQKIEDYILEADLSQTKITDLFMIKNSLVAQLESIERKTKGNPQINQTNILGEVETLEIKLNEIN
jgi:predicted XRE-type DNA-binding protein